MKLRLFAVALLAAMPLATVSALVPTRAHAANTTPTGGAVSTPVTGKFTGSAGDLKGPGTMSGTLNIRHFAMQNHHLYAQGTITGVLKEANGKTKNVSQAVNVPVGIATTGAHVTSSYTQPMSNPGLAPRASSCNILTLNLGPLHLNLLGLVVDLSPVNLTITGQTGSGNLLGNLLCGIAGLLNNLSLSSLTQTLLQDIVLLLNQVLHP